MEAVRSIWEHLQRLVDERERMDKVLSDYAAGSIPSRDIPPDAHTYYGRIREADAAIERYAAEEASRILHLDQQTPERRERLQNLLNTERGHIEDTTNLPIPLTWRLAAETADQITAGWRAVEVVSAVEASAALNYWRGRAEEFNATREAIVRHHPELARDLPPALEVDEIQVRQRVLEREHRDEKSLAVTP